jgi:uncharacterized membrane protein
MLPASGMANRLEELLYPADQIVIRSALESAAQRTSVEFNVHVEDTCRYPEARALGLFRTLQAARAGRRHGVLLFLLSNQRHCLIVVDEAVRPLEGTRVWRDVANRLTIDLLHGKIGQGVADAVTRFSHILAGHFPRQLDETATWDEVSSDEWEEISAERPPLPAVSTLRR